MSPARSNRSVIWLAIPVGLLLAAGAAEAQAPPAADQPNNGAATPLAPSRLMPPGYNPGEMLKDLANPVVAEVEGHQITLAEVGDAVRTLPETMRNMPFEDLYPGVLERLIQQQALVSKARRMRLDIDPVVKRHMQEAADRVLENELLNRLIDKNITEAALLARYQKQYADKPGPEEVNVRVILLPSEEKARKVIAELAGGADFATVARRDSKDASAPQGGDLGFLRQDKLIPEVGAAAFVLEPGRVSPNPVQTRTGWFVVRVDARRRVAQPGFAEVREQLRRELLQEGAAQAAREAVAGSTVRRFEMNGTSRGDGTEEPGGGTRATR